MPPPPPDPLQEYLKVAGMSAAVSTHFMEFHKLFTIEGMLLFFLSKSQDLIKICNGQKTRQTSKLGMAVQKS